MKENFSGIIPKEAAKRIIEILARHGMVSDGMYDNLSFYRSALRGDLDERLLSLYSGKFYNNAGRWFVLGLSEYATPERNALEGKVNKNLAELYDEYH